MSIEITNTPNLESKNQIAKIENFLKNSSYIETIEFSANFNKTLSNERRHRLPFLDPQTNVAQNHSNLFMSERQRLPGLRKGQIYSYPSNRWRKTRRSQYLDKFYSKRYFDRPFQTFKKESSEVVLSHAGPSDELNGALFEDTSLGGTGDNTSDSNSNQQQQQQQQSQQPTPIKEEWYYDEVDVNDIDSLEEPKSPADDEYDYDPRYGNKKRRKRRPGKKALAQMQGGESSRKSNSRNSSGGGGHFSSVTGRKGRGGRRSNREQSLASLRNSLIDPPSPEPQNEPVSFETALGDVYRL